MEEPETATRLIMRIAQRLRQTMGASFDAADMGGLTPHQARTVGYIEANESRGLIQRDIAEMSGTRPASVSSLLQGLEQDGWIERRVDPSDSRRKTLHVTDKGRDVVHRFEAGLWASVDTGLAGLTDEENATLVSLLSKVDRHLAG